MNGERDRTQPVAGTFPDLCSAPLVTNGGKMELGRSREVIWEAGVTVAKVRGDVCLVQMSKEI